MKQERMKDAMKDTFSKLELSENAKEEVWEQIAEKIEHSNGKKEWTDTESADKNSSCRFGGSAAFCRDQ